MIKKVIILVVMIIAAFLVRTVVIAPYDVPTSSMEKTLLPGDHVLANKLAYGLTLPGMKKRLVSFSSPKLNDVVIFEAPEEATKVYTKRIIAIGGDTIKIKEKKVFINGVPCVISTILQYGFDRSIQNDPNPNRIIEILLFSCYFS